MEWVSQKVEGQWHDLVTSRTTSSRNFRSNQEQGIFLSTFLNIVFSQVFQLFLSCPFQNCISAYKSNKKLNTEDRTQDSLIIGTPVLKCLLVSQGVYWPSLLLPCEFSHCFWQMGNFSVDLQLRAGTPGELGWRFDFCPWSKLRWNTRHR